MSEKKKDKKEVKALEKELTKLEEKIESLEGEKAELLDKLKRIGADYANFQKRAPKQIAEATKLAQKKAAELRKKMDW